MNCKKCSSELGIEEKFCSKCGEEVLKEKVSFFSRKTGLKYPFNTVLSTIIFVVVIATISGFIAVNNINTGNKGSSLKSNEEYINQGVESYKAKLTLPMKVDDYTTLVDITPELNAIRYHYLLSGINENNVSDSALRDVLLPNVCGAKELRAFFDKNINLEYSYGLDGSMKTYFVTFTKNDCQK